MFGGGGPADGTSAVCIDHSREQEDPEGSARHAGPQTRRRSDTARCLATRPVGQVEPAHAPLDNA
jgi:hypothetical protein